MCENPNKKEKCKYKAYYHSKKLGFIFCGRCKNSLRVEDAVKLKPAPKDELYASLAKEAGEAAVANKSDGKLRVVKVGKLRMMKAPEYEKGFLHVFPNFRHAKKRDGFGANQLSPKYLGPIVHNMKDMPSATSIENYHQFSKVYARDLESGDVRETIRVGYVDKVPRRHKHEDSPKEKPLYSLYFDREGNELKYTYVQSRVVYSKWYEVLVKETEQWKKLVGEIGRAHV